MKHDIVIVGGFGHVGLPLAISLADRGASVCALDIDERAMATIGDGRMPFYEDGAEVALRRVLQNGKLSPGKLAGMWALGQTVVLWNQDPKDFGMGAVDLDIHARRPMASPSPAGPAATAPAWRANAALTALSCRPQAT